MILEAATAFFAEDGYRSTDVQHIADRLGLGKGTIYRYFPTKEELFFASVDRAMARMEEYIHKQIEGVTDDVARMREAIRAYIAFYKKNPQFTELFVQERAEFRKRDVSTYLVHRAKQDGEWRAIFQRLFDQGKMRVANFDYVIEYITNGLYGIMFTSAFAQEGFDPSRTDEALNLLLFGVLKEEAV